MDKKNPAATTLFQINQYNTKLKKTGDVDKKIPDTSGLVTTTFLNTKISEVENKIPDKSGSVTTIVLNRKIRIIR